MNFFPHISVYKIIYRSAGSVGGRETLNVQAIFLVLSRRFPFPFFSVWGMWGKGCR